MSEDEVTGNMRVVSGDTGGGAAFLAVGTADLAGDTPAEGSDCHVIELRGADGWDLVHPVQCTESLDCAVTEAAGRISRAVCATGGRWTCAVDAGGLTLLERLGD